MPSLQDALAAIEKHQCAGNWPGGSALADVQILELAGGLHEAVERHKRRLLIRRKVGCGCEPRPL